MARQRRQAHFLSFVFPLLYLLLSVWSAAASTRAAAEQGLPFENTAVVRVVELAGSLVHIRTTFAARAKETGSVIYTFALGREDAERTRFLQARVKNEKNPLDLQELGLNAQSNAYLYTVVLPKSLKKGEDIAIELEAVQSHATYPWPAAIGQTDEQAFKYETDAFIISPYPTSVQRTKFKVINPNIISYTEPKNMGAFTLDAPVTKSGGTITYGPYNNVPASATSDFAKNIQQRVTVHFKHDTPVIRIPSMKRAAEISHWGANLNIQDDIWLYNAGPTLKGHFSRVEYQQAMFFNRQQGHVLRSLTLPLPAGIQDAYFIDSVGNVSTSNLRVAPSVPKGTRAPQPSILELRPRYPLMGGWNYTFTLGWDSPLRDSAAYDAQTGKYIVAVPIMTQFPDAVVEDAEVKLILPEGATDVSVSPPFPPADVKTSTHKSYLDTKGRPTVSLFYKNLTDAHNGIIYVMYRVPLIERLRKPITISGALLSLFMLSSVLRRLDMRIRSKSNH